MPAITLRAVKPNAIEFAGRRLRIGRMAYDLLALVIDGGGTADVRVLNERVWGAADSPRGRLDSMANRLNAKLAAVGCELRVAVDAGRVLLI